MLKLFKKAKDRLIRWLTWLQGHGFVRSPKTGVWVVGGDIALNGEDYRNLIKALRRARHGDHIYIIILDNEGGRADVGYTLHDEIMASKAVVSTEARVWAASAALDVLFSGDYVHMPKLNGADGIGVAHLSYGGDENNKLRTPEMRKYDEARMQFYRPFLTEEQWKRVLAGEDVKVFGEEACRIAGEKTVDTPDYCVIKRDKRYDN